VEDGKYVFREALPRALCLLAIASPFNAAETCAKPFVLQVGRQRFAVRDLWRKRAHWLP
jgi:hypothetical protein